MIISTAREGFQAKSLNEVTQLLIPHFFFFHWTSLVAQTVKHLPIVRETWVQSLGWEDLLEKDSCLENPKDGRRSLVSYSPWGRKESDTTEQHG